VATDENADALMVRLSNFLPAGPDRVIAYFKAISATVRFPIATHDIGSPPLEGRLDKPLCELVSRPTPASTCRAARPS
jgi:hypothetical protein